MYHIFSILGLVSTSKFFCWGYVFFCRRRLASLARATVRPIKQDLLDSPVVHVGDVESVLRAT